MTMNDDEDVWCPEDNIDPSWVDDFADGADVDVSLEDMHGGWDEQPYDYWE
jgi:hypothetical protein